MLESNAFSSVPKKIASRNLMKSGLTGRSLAFAAALALGVPLLNGLTGSAHAATSPYFFYSGGKKNYLTASTKWAAVELAPNANASSVVKQATAFGLVAPNGKVVEAKRKNIVILPLNTGSGKLSSSQANADLANIGGVTKTLRAYGDAKEPLIETKEIAVRFKSGISASQAKEILAKYQAVKIRPLGAYAPNGYLVRLKDNSTLTALGVANALHDSSLVVFSHPNFIWPVEPRQVTATPTPEATAIPTATPPVNDPLYPDQWHLHNTGQGGGVVGADVRAPEAWAITKGDPNIVVAVIDTGIDIDHEDLKDKVVFPYDADDDDNDPRPTDQYDIEDHGTSVSGVAVGTGDNGIGITGAAPNCKLMPIRLINGATTLEAISRAFLWATDHGADVINNSWGPSVSPAPMPDEVKAAIDYAVTKGRNGKGCVVLFASGNGAGAVDGNQTVDDDGIASYDSIIAVGASNNFDRRASYSEGGKTLDIVAPSGALGFNSSLNIVTTDRTGTAGYNTGIGYPLAYRSGNYTTSGYDGFNGTSSACPLASGIVALLLSQEPNLNYTEVRQRLIETARKIDTDNGNYDSNGFSEQYGYGCIDALAVLRGDPATPTLITPPDNATVPSGTYTVSARTANDDIVKSVAFSYRSLLAQATRNINKAIPDANLNSSGILEDEITFSGNASTASSYAIVDVNINHSYIGDLQVTLIAPDGTATVLYDHTGGAQDSLNQTYTLPLAQRPLNGTYKLEVSDDAQEDTGTLVSWGLKLVSDWTDIGTTEARSSNGLYSVPWDTTKRTAGLYEVRAVVNAGNFGTFTDINTNIQVSGAAVTKPTVSGKVVNANNIGVAGVLITLGDGGRTTTTDAKGEYTFTNVTPGTYTVTPSKLRSIFDPAARRITVAAKNLTAINFKLTATDSIAPTVTVSQPAVAPNNRYLRLSAATGTAVDTGGSGLATVTGLLYRYKSATQTAGYWAGGSSFTTTYSAKNEMPARLVTISGHTTYSLTFPTLGTGTYYFRATATDRAGNVGRSATVVFAIDNSAPVVKISTPVKNASNVAGFFKQATGTVSDDGGVATVTILLSRLANGKVTAGYWNGKSFSTKYVPTDNEVAATLTGSIWRFTLPVLEPTRYSLRATATDRAGNVGRSETVTFTVQAPATDNLASTPNPAPSRVAISAASVSADGVVRLTFSGGLNADIASDVAHYAVTVDGASVAVEAVSYSTNDNTITLLLPGSVSVKSSIEITWSGLQDAQGHPLADGSQCARIR